MRAHPDVRPSCVTIGYRPKFSPPSPFPRARKLVTSLACIAIGAVSVAAAVDVLTRESAQALPAPWSTGAAVCTRDQSRNEPAAGADHLQRFCGFIS